MLGVQDPRVRPHTVPQSRVTVGPWGPMIPSRSFGGSSAAPDTPSTPTAWTPNGVFAPFTRPFRPLPYGLGGNQSSRSHGGWYTPPALWDLTSMAGGFLYPTISRKRGGTVPYVQTKSALNPFPSFAPPLPSYPAPAAWTGRL